MASSTTYSTSWVDFLPLALIFLAVVLVYSSGRSKKLKCPECGAIFDSPAMDNKRSGVGWTLPYMGTVKCPKCGQSRSRRDYQKVKVQAPKFTGVLRQEDPKSPPAP